MPLPDQQHREQGLIKRPAMPLMPSLAKDAELVALGVGQHDPRSIPLADVHTPCAMSDQASNLGVLVIRPEVEVQSALGLLALIEPDEVQPRRAIRLRADLELVSRGVDDNPTKRVGPPLPQGHWIHRVDNHLFPFQGHRANLDLRGLQGQAFSLGEAARHGRRHVAADVPRIKRADLPLMARTHVPSSGRAQAGPECVSGLAATRPLYATTGIWPS